MLRSMRTTFLMVLICATFYLTTAKHSLLTTYLHVSQPEQQQPQLNKLEHETKTDYVIIGNFHDTINSNSTKVDGIDKLTSEGNPQPEQGLYASTKAEQKRFIPLSLLVQSSEYPQVTKDSSRRGITQTIGSNSSLIDLSVLDSDNAQTSIPHIDAPKQHLESVLEEGSQQELFPLNKTGIAQGTSRQQPRVKRYLFDDKQHAGKCETRRPAIYGLRCDSGEVKDGVLVLKANEATELLLIGNHLDSNLSIALTPSEGSAQDDCTHTDRVKSLHVRNISSNIAQVVVDLASPGPKTPFYLCIREARDGAGWFHQGSDPWLKIYVKQDFLPLYMKILVIACLLMLSGLFSGLNLGLMALDKNELQVIISCGTETEKRYARAIEPVRRRGNYLLCSILFSNVLVNSTIAVLLEELTSGIVAVMTSTIFIVMFGEILPQAFCSRHGLAVGAKTVSITYFCMIVTFPLSYPVSACLDWALGEEIGHAYDRERLMEFIRVTRDYNELAPDEVNIISGALKLKQIQLREIMTRIDDVFMLDVNSVLDFDTIQSIIAKGYSRIPIHEAGNKKNIIALLFAKDLALLDPDDKTPVQTLIRIYEHPIVPLFEDETLDKALDQFKTGKSHMALVKRVLGEGELDPVYEITGIVTLEDVIEEIMQMEINDETDTLSDNRRKRRRKEAQVVKDFSQFANLGAGDSSFNVVTPQLRMAAYQYLATTVEPFSAKSISDAVLKRLLLQKIYYKVRIDEHHSEKRLYTAGEPADYFVMILEGRVHVVCGRENLVFDGGPFSFFGKAALAPQAFDQKDSLTLPCGSTTKLPNSSTSRKESSNAKPLLERRESQVSRTVHGQFSISMRKLEQVVGSADNVNNTTNTSGAGLNISTTGTRLKTSESRTSIYSMDRASATSHFIPDYTVEIVVNTSYLKITRNEYQTALRATLVERGGVPDDLAASDGQSNSNSNIINSTSNQASTPTI